MTVNAIASAVTATTPGLLASSTNSTTDANALGKDTFLQLLVAQLRYQDPMNPTDSSAFLAQSAQFTALEKMQAVADQTAKLVTAQVAFGASSLIGKTVTYPTTPANSTGTAPADGTSDDTSLATGVVESVRFDSTGPVLVVNGQDVAVSSVRSVTAPISTATSPAVSTPATP